MVKTPRKTLSIIIPALREEKRIGKTLKALAKYLDSHFKDYKVEVIVVAADAPDDTAGVVKAHKKLFRKHSFKLLQPGPKVGKGRDVQYGMLRATGDFRIFMDADMATPLKYLTPMVKGLEDGADMVIGIRDIRKIHAGIVRSTISRGGNVVSKVMVNVYYPDTQCGFKGFTKKAVDLCFKKQAIMGWGFDIEILAIAHLYHLEVVQLPIHDWKDIDGGNLNENAIRSSLRTFREIKKVRENIHNHHYVKKSK